jgi:hypothetical protein
MATFHDTFLRQLFITTRTMDLEFTEPLHHNLVNAQAFAESLLQLKGVLAFVGTELQWYGEWMVLYQFSLLTHMHSDGTAQEYGMGGAVQQFDEDGNHCMPGVFIEDFHF